MFKFPSKKKKPRISLGIDIGTEAVKAVIFKREPRLKILAHSLEYFDRYGVFDSKSFEIDLVRKTLLKVIKDLKRTTSVKPEKAILLLPPTVFKARVIDFDFEREDLKPLEKDEREKIINQMTQESKKRVGSEIGILPKDLYFQGGSILERKIDGYQVPSLLGFKGKEIEIKFLALFLLRDYFDNIKEIRDLLGMKTRIVHESEGLGSWLNSFDPNSLFLDVGGRVTQFFLVKQGIEEVNDFRGGGKDFSDLLSEELGLNENRARVLKERYARGELREASKAIENFFKKRAQLWINDLKEKLAVFEKSITSSEIYLFGGGSNLPEIQASLGEVKLLNPQRFIKQELGIEYTPLILCLKKY